MVADDDQLRAHADWIRDAALKMEADWELDQGDLIEIEDWDFDALVTSGTTVRFERPALYVGRRDGIPHMLVDGELRALEGVLRVCCRVRDAVG